MDGVALLLAADMAGLKVNIGGERLIVRGPKRLKPLAEQLLARKAEVMDLIRGGSWPLPRVEYSTAPVRPGPPKACYGCGRIGWFTTTSNAGRDWGCAACHPPLWSGDIVWWEGNQEPWRSLLTSPHARTKVAKAEEIG